MQTKNTLKRYGVILSCLSFIGLPGFSQFTTCDTNLINAHLNPAGYTRLYVPTQPCSIYFYNPTPMYGIDAHRSAANLGVPMVVMNDSQENADVKNALFAQGVFPTNPEVWLGITDSATTFTWRTFATGGPVTYFNWTAGEPNNLYPSCKIGNSCLVCLGPDAYWCANGEDCAVLNASGEWLDNTCEGQSITRIAVLELNTCPVLSKPNDTTICAGTALNVHSSVSAGGTAPYSYTWNPGSLTGPTVTLHPTTDTTYTIQASDLYHCLTDSTFAVTVIPAPTADAGPDIQLCPGVTGNLGTAPTPGVSYSWSPAWGLDSLTSSAPTVNIPSNSRTTSIDTTYIVTATSGGCSASDSVNVTIYPNINNNFATGSNILCMGDNMSLTYSGLASGTATYTWDFDSATILSGTGAGGYVLNWPTLGSKTITLSVTDHGCSNTPVSKTISVVPTPIAIVTNSGRDTLTTTTFTSYQWLRNGTIIPSATSQSYIATSNGNYQVLVTDSAGCTDTSAVYNVTGVGISEISDPSNILIYPNPNSGSFIIETHGAMGNDLVITDILGRVVMKQTINTDKQIINMEPIAAGEYYATIRVKGRLYTNKITITK